MACLTPSIITKVYHDLWVEYWSRSFVVILTTSITNHSSVSWPLGVVFVTLLCCRSDGADYHSSMSRPLDGVFVTLLCCRSNGADYHSSMSRPLDGVFVRLLCGRSDSVDYHSSVSRPLDGVFVTLLCGRFDGVNYHRSAIQAQQQKDRYKKNLNQYEIVIGSFSYGFLEAWVRFLRLFKALEGIISSCASPSSCVLAVDI